MIETAFWRRLDVSGRDVARLTNVADGYVLAGQAVFLDPCGPAALQYMIQLAPDWTTREGRIQGFIGSRTVETRVIRTERGWLVNERDFQMAEVLDLDLGFTPATNTAQLRRIALAVGQEAGFDVAWLDAGSTDLIPLPQNYRRISDAAYDYRSPTVGYEATISLAENGFAADYPGLWKLEA